MTSVLALLVVLGWTTQDDLDQQVTFETRAAPMERVLAQVTERTHVRLTADSQIRREVAVVSVADVSLRDLMKRFAKALHGEWLHSNDGYRLTLTSKIEKQEKALELAERCADLKSCLEAANQHVEPSLDAGKARVLAQRILLLEKEDETTVPSKLDLAKLGSPYSRAILRLLSDLPLADIANLKERERVVFALTPTRAQKPFGPKAPQILADLVRDQGTWSTELQGIRISMGSFIYQTERKPLPDPLPKLTLAVSGFMRGTIQATLWMAAPRGPVYLGQFLSLIVSKKALALPGKPPAGDAVALSEQTKELLAAVKDSPYTGGTGVAPKSRDLLDRICDPTRNEPLATLPSDGLLQIAHGGHRNLIAWIPDGILPYLCVMATRAPLTLPQFQELLTSTNGIALADDEKWLIGTPRSPIAARVDEADREPLRDLLQLARKNGRLRLINVARYAAGTEGGMWSGFSRLLLTIVYPGLDNSFSRPDWDVLRLYGSLSDEAIRALENGAKMPFASLTERQRRFATSLAYSDLIRSADYLASDQVSSDRRIAIIEPTEALPDGLPATGYLTIPTVSLPVIYAYGKSPEGVLAPVRAVETWDVAIRLNSPPQGADRGLPWAAYLTGEQAMHKVSLVFSEDAFNQYPIFENTPGTGEPGPWEKLPDKIVAQIREYLKGMNDPGGSNKVPPPR